MTFHRKVTLVNVLALLITNALSRSERQSRCLLASPLQLLALCTLEVVVDTEFLTLTSSLHIFMVAEETLTS